MKSSIGVSALVHSRSLRGQILCRCVKFLQCRTGPAGIGIEIGIVVESLSDFDSDFDTDTDTDTDEHVSSVSGEAAPGMQKQEVYRDMHRSVVV